MSGQVAEFDRAQRRRRRVDAGLSAMLVLQGVTLFLVLPLGGTMGGRVLLDTCHVGFATICVGVLARRRKVQAALLALLATLVAGPWLARQLSAELSLSAAAQHELIALVAFGFNASATALVTRHVFAAGRVTAHRVRGAILLYLNVAALFAIAYGALAMRVPGAFLASGAALPPGGNAAFSYFSLSTITTTGFGDIVPVHPLARSLANLEAVFGQLFPATLLARLVSLHLVHEREEAGRSW